MRNAFVIAGKDLRSAVVTPVAYVVFTGYLLLSAFFFFTLLQQFNSMADQAALMPKLSPNLNDWVVVPFYQTMQIVLIFLVPLLTMRAIAEEKNQGTFEMLVTSPLTISDIVIGKTLSICLQVVVMLLSSFVFPILLVVYGDPAHPPELVPIIVGMFGLVLFGCSFSAIGIAVSACTRSQTVAGVLSLVLLLVFFVVDAPASQLTGTPAAVIRYIAPSGHAELLFKGVVQGSDIVYFLTVILFGVFFTNRVLDAERWR